jgi:UDP-N-acetylmuramate--alanine ligase
MIGRILRVANQNPTLIVGGVVAELGTGATLGSGQYLVAEADEYDKSFLAMFPSMAVVLNIEADHLDCYRDFDEIKESFLTYMNRVPFFGAVIASADDPAIASIRSKIARPTHTFGFSVDADYRAVDVKYEMGRSRFTVFRRGNPLGEVILRVPGRHNVANALAAIAATFELDIPFLTITDALRDFTGVGRRFEIIGEENGVLVIDDYAHHPTEIRATLTTAKETLGRRIVAVFQPHLYSRTRDFVKDFATALDIADEVFLTDIYPAREVAIPGVTSELIRDESVRQGGKRFTCVGTKDHAIAAVVPHLKRGDAVLLIGAGSITYLKQPLLETLRKTELA